MDVSIESGVSDYDGRTYWHVKVDGNYPQALYFREEAEARGVAIALRCGAVVLVDEN